MAMYFEEIQIYWELHADRWKVSLCHHGCWNSKFKPWHTNSLDGKASMESEPAQQMYQTLNPFLSPDFSVQL